MSLEDFWVNVRSGCVRFNRDFQIDRPFMKREEILAKLRDNDFWFRKQSVAGFIEADFEFLGTDTQTKLSTCVKEFEGFLSNITPKLPPTSLEANTSSPPEVKEQALNHFADIIETLEFGRYGNAEGFRLGKRIEKELKPCPPEGVADLRFDAGVDHSGDPALWIWVFVDQDNSLPDERFLAKTQEVREIIDPIARHVCGDRWPYFRMLSVDDDGISEWVHATPPTPEAHS